MAKILKSVLSLFLAVFMVVSLAAVPSSAISISKSSITLTKGYQTTLSVSGTSKSVTWSTGNKSIATVTSKGKVVGKAPGSTYIYAKVGGTTLRCKVTVVAAKITASSSNVTFDKKGQTKTITMTVKGSHSGLTVGTTNKKVVTASWVKPVSWDGDKIKIKLTAQGNGSAKVKVYLKNYSSTCYKNITVNVGDDDEDIYMDDDQGSSTSSNKMAILPYTNSVEVSAGGTYKLSVYSSNHNTMLYTLSDTSIASVSAGTIAGYYRTFTITGLKEGTTTLRLYDKNDTKTYYDVKITVNANKYYELYTVRPTPTNSTDQVIQVKGSNSNTTYYMLVPANYDPAYANDAIAKQFNKYSYYTVYSVIPTRISSNDRYYEFMHSNSKYNYGKRYILLPVPSDDVTLQTTIAQYNEAFEYWKVYTAEPIKINQWDYVESWQIINSDTGKTTDRYMLVPYYEYDADRINEIKDKDMSANRSYNYYVGYARMPAVKSTKDKTIMYRKNNAYCYMVVPADDSGIAKANDAIAKDVGFFEYNVIYSVVPTTTGDEIYHTVQDGGNKYYILLKDKDQTIDVNVAKDYANGVKDD